MSANMDEFIDAPNVDALGNFKKSELLALAQKLGLDELKGTMRKNEICRNIAEYYVEEEIFSETDVEYFPVKKSNTDQEEREKDRQAELKLQLQLKQLELEAQERQRLADLEQKRLEIEAKEKEEIRLADLEQKR